ncbi:hypothetical protein Q4610_21465 [Sphingobium sp. HBC34]|jgi:hypothetical protein|uniref:GNAT family N-acetyltransferase n=1 Tax=Sphingobium cyanobacteriorum TaxID=3063954 RepID=A0ABT8ZSV0_9SPHN|nr:hypothetical protein [Sphingobium sp. HBC34]MDO7837605.1 hypothetical protein [Sphingobium sp. HBC34]
MSAIRPATEQDATAILTSIDCLREARNLLRQAGASKAARAVATAMKSAQGAERHVRHRIRRTQHA